MAAVLAGGPGAVLTDGDRAAVGRRGPTTGARWERRPSPRALAGRKPSPASRSTGGAWTRAT